MRNFCIHVIFLLLTLPVAGQHIHYRFAAPNAVHHEAEISVTVDGLTGSVAIFRMSRSSPGRYATHEFGKNVYNVKALDAAGKLLKIEKNEADVYKVTGFKGPVVLNYTLYGDYADGTYASIDVSGYHLNMPACFMWVKGLEKAPISIQFAMPSPGWKIATQLKPTADPTTFTAPGLQYFMDSPTKIGELQMGEWEVINTDGKPYTFRLALEADASAIAIDSFTEKLKRVVEAGKRVFGEIPAYDYGTYTFIASIHPFVHGDGMEHRNSTMITIPADFDAGDELLSVFAHEFFHCWNVERIRPRSLEPFNFEKSNMSEALWLAEGFTQYYGSILRSRAGLLREAAFLTNMGALVNAKVNSPGAQTSSPVDNSQRAVFVDAGVSVDRTNYPNMYTSYYYYGGALALALDLTLRGRFKSSLDDLMKGLWKKQGKHEIPYTLSDVQSSLALVSNPSFAADFFRQYVYGHDPIDYSQLLSLAGYSITSASAGNASLGPVNFDSAESGLKILGNTIRNSPLYEAGLDEGDIIVQLNGRKLNSVSDLYNVTNRLKPGEQVPIAFYHRKTLVNSKIKLYRDPYLKIEKQAALTIEQQEFKNKWMHVIDRERQ